jgi:hypothetical protein
MPMEDWIQHWKAARFLYDWQTLIAGALAVLAALRTIRATVRSADREIKASQEQTAVAQKQIETTIRLERRRAASEGYAFHAMLEAAMGRVLAEATEAESIFASANQQSVSSTTAYEARQSLTKSAFDELRSACVEHGGNLTAKFLDLEGEIDKFKQWEARQNEVRKGLHAGFQQQLDLIEAKAKTLRREAGAEMERATIVIAETEVPHA